LSALAESDFVVLAPEVAAVAGVDLDVAGVGFFLAAADGPCLLAAAVTAGF